MGLKSAGEGQIVQVQGGHIIRATGRKDRHSKVFTAKGPRDRRVRLSANTAIQFYDVQDRLGYDRPSKAVDWLIKNAEASINKLAELPPWDPCAGLSNAADGNVSSGEIPVSDHTGTSYNLPSSNEYVPQGGDSMKSFFPTTTEDNPMNFQSYPHGLISTGSNQSQDLCLSLQTLQDPGTTTHQTHSNHDQTLFQGSESLGFDIGSSGWAEQHHHHQDMARFTRLMGWAGNGGGGGSEDRVGILFNPSPLLPPQALLLNQQGSNVTYSQRGTLQSSFPILAPTLEDHQHQHQLPISGLGPGSDAFMGFCLPSHIHGDLHGGACISNRASSSSLSLDSSQH